MPRAARPTRRHAPAPTSPAAIAPASGSRPGRRAGRRAYEPVDEEELGVTRRQFFNRGILTGHRARRRRLRRRVARVPVAQRRRGGFGGKVTVGSVDDVAEGDRRQDSPIYNASAKVYIQPYPKARREEGEEGLTTSRRSSRAWSRATSPCTRSASHLGCRVPWCQTSQWFECPCHGSKYNRVGEKRGGPAPRGLDRFALTVSGGSHRRRHRHDRTRAPRSAPTPPVRAKRARRASDAQTGPSGTESDGTGVAPSP